MSEPEATYEYTDEDAAKDNKIASEVLDALFAKSEEEEQDPVGAAYSLWIDLVHVLAEANWDMDDLTSDLQRHFLMHDCMGTA